MGGLVDRSSIFELAAALCVGIAKNRPCNDGNKRTALLSARAFLYLNGYELEPGQKDEVLMMVAVASGSIGESELTSWLDENAARSK